MFDTKSGAAGRPVVQSLAIPTAQQQQQLQQQQQENVSGDPAQVTQDRPKKKKRHNHGVYPCDHPNCSKVFQRSDHLSRHKLTHNSSLKNYECTWPGCEKKFSRTDTLKLHYNRHYNRQLKKQGRNVSATAMPSSMPSAVPSPITPVPQQVPQYGIPMNSINSSSLNTVDSSKTPTTPGGSIIATQANFTSARNTPVYSEVNANLTSDRIANNDQRMMTPTERFNQLKTIPMSAMNTPVVPNDMNLLITDDNRTYMEPFMQPSDLLSILFPEDVSSTDSHMDSTKLETTLPSLPPNFELNSNVERTYSSFLDSKGQNMLDYLPITADGLIKPMGLETFIDREVIQRMLLQIPNLAFNSDFHEILLQRALQIFWGLYNRRLSVVHKPSFDPKKAPAILLLAMIMVGAAMTRCTEQVETVFTNPQKLAEDIAVPLRWVIFQSADVMTPKTYIIQSLIMLENFEKHLSTRELFQRSTIHQAAKVQILRRSTTLGGAPYRRDNFEAEFLWGATNKSTQLWNKWIELESMKRSAYMTFVCDSYNALLTCQEVALYAHQLKLSLPCDEELWLTLNFEEDYLKTYEWKTASFLTAFVDMINENATCDAYSASGLLFSGLVTLIFLFQSTNSIKFINKIVNESWKKVLAYSLESWLVNIRGDCCKSHPMRQSSATNYGTAATSTYFSDNDHRCKMPLYHLAHSVVRISNFDWMTYAGAPLLKNIRADYTDYRAVSTRIKHWATSQEGGLCLVHAYLLLIECFLPHDDEADFVPYLPERDVYFERPHCLGQLSIIAWSYCFILKGPESIYLTEEMNYNYYIADRNSINPHVREEGYSYLKRVKDCFAQADIEFNKLIQMEKPDTTLTSEAARRTKIFHRRIELYADALNLLPNLNHIAGLMLVTADMYAKCQNLELCLEIGRLIKHCQSRSMGNPELKCTNMYKFDYQ